MSQIYNPRDLSCVMELQFGQLFNISILNYKKDPGANVEIYSIIRHKGVIAESPVANLLPNRQHKE